MECVVDEGASSWPYLSETTFCLAAETYSDSPLQPSQYRTASYTYGMSLFCGAILSYISVFEITPDFVPLAHCRCCLINFTKRGIFFRRE